MNSAASKLLRQILPAVLLACCALPSIAAQAQNFGHESPRTVNSDYQQRQQEQHASDPRRGKLSPDERRELRRQIDEAGHDIYKRR